MATQTFNYRGYLLTCSAVADSAGTFRSGLLAASVAWPSRPRIIAMERAQHDTPDSAIEEAHRQGVRWVENHG